MFALLMLCLMRLRIGHLCKSQRMCVYLAQVYEANSSRSDAWLGEGGGFSSRIRSIKRRQGPNGSVGEPRYSRIGHGVDSSMILMCIRPRHA